MSKLLQLKLELYHELLIKSKETLTNVEIDIMYYLSQDKDVQEHISYKLNGG